MTDFKIQVEGMSCQHCVMRVKKSLETLKGTQNITVNLKEKYASGQYDEAVLTLQQIKETIRKTGYEAK